MRYVRPVTGNRKMANGRWQIGAGNRKSEFLLASRRGFRHFSHA